MCGHVIRNTLYDFGYQFLVLHVPVVEIRTTDDVNRALQNGEKGGRFQVWSIEPCSIEMSQTSRKML
jgi:hypothetical protein